MGRIDGIVESKCMLDGRNELGGPKGPFLCDVL